MIDIWREGCILPFPKKGNLSITNNYRGITLTSIAAKIFNMIVINRIRPGVDLKLRKIKIPLGQTYRHQIKF